MRGSRARRSSSSRSREVAVERIVERAGALDVHRASVTACVRVWHERELTEHVTEFQTTVSGLLALRDWLEAANERRRRYHFPGRQERLLSPQLLPPRRV